MIEGRIPQLLNELKKLENSKKQTAMQRECVKIEIEAILCATCPPYAEISKMLKDEKAMQESMRFSLDNYRAKTNDGKIRGLSDSLRLLHDWLLSEE